jgi:hypothetical protein
MRSLLQSRDAHAAEAVDLFVDRIAAEIGALAAALGGVDALVFTAGIGEHAPAIRARVSSACAWLGATLDSEANDAIVISSAELLGQGESAASVVTTAVLLAATANMLVKAGMARVVGGLLWAPPSRAATARSCCAKPRAGDQHRCADRRAPRFHCKTVMKSSGSAWPEKTRLR